MTIFNNNGFWFAVGVVVGLLIEFGGTFFFDWYRKPNLAVGLEGLCPVISGATTLVAIPGLPAYAVGATQRVSVLVYRFRVNNSGRRAAENAAGTLEFDNVERRVCWYEGNTPTITINARDHSYLDVYGVVLNAQNNPTNDIVMPTERGWTGLPTRALTAPLRVSLRITAANGGQTKTEFCIDPAQQCRPVL